MSSCAGCDADGEFLRTSQRPDYESLPSALRVVDLFCGGGGLTVGVAEAARRAGRGTDVVLAVESDHEAADVYALNFPKAHLVRDDVSALFDGSPGGSCTESECELRRTLGDVDILVAGPPCQGHSDLNNHTRRDDPRNALYLRAIRAVEVLRPSAVLIENVPAVLHDKEAVTNEAVHLLEKSDYRVASAVLALVRFGVPQRRKRHILLATKGDFVDPEGVLGVASTCVSHEPRTVGWAILDLFASTSDVGPDSPARASADNKERMRYLLEEGIYDLPNRLRPKCHHGEHSYHSMYGRLRWGEPAQTITTGFGSMGQGRFVHPAAPRTLTPHEAARLQTLPDFFDLGASNSRRAWATVIGNAVPPLFGVHVVESLLRALPGEDRTDHGDGCTTTDVAEVSPSAGLGASHARRSRVPAASNETIRRRMSTTRQRDTRPELAIRSAIHRMGMRFRVDYRFEGTRWKGDIVFPAERVAVFVDGCFWHRCPEHGTVPKQNTEWWTAKLVANSERDRSTDHSLEDAGWRVLRFWEHDDPADAAEAIRAAVTSRRRTRRA